MGLCALHPKALLRHRPGQSPHPPGRESLEPSLPGKQWHVSVYKHSFDITQTLVRIPVPPVSYLP